MGGTLKNTISNELFCHATLLESCGTEIHRVRCAVCVSVCVCLCVCVCVCVPRKGHCTHLTLIKTRIQVMNDSESLLPNVLPSWETIQTEAKKEWPPSHQYWPFRIGRKKARVNVNGFGTKKYVLPTCKVQATWVLQFLTPSNAKRHFPQKYEQKEVLSVDFRILRWLGPIQYDSGGA